jgi:2-C-methyl-D-erythritol 4-phosphate cytidylyltransferase
MKENVIIVAGGSGSRMQSDIPKQFIAVNGLPILMHTIQAFKRYSPDVSIVLVLPLAHFAFWDQLTTQYGFSHQIHLVAGGATRFHSVKNGLNSLKDDESLIAVHDGVRPVISSEIIASSFAAAAEFGTAVTAVNLKDSLRLVKENGQSIASDRTSFRIVQTPQTFRSSWMRTAFEQPYRADFTDCASVLEAAGYPIHLIEGSYQNIKITTPEDLKWAGIYLTKVI